LFSVILIDEQNILLSYFKVFISAIETIYNNKYIFSNFYIEAIRKDKVEVTVEKV